MSHSINLLPAFEECTGPIVKCVFEPSECSTKECSICFDSISTKKNACITECGHEFCFKCILKTMASDLGNNNLCPLCRTEMFEYEEDDDEGSSNDEESVASLDEDVHAKATLRQITSCLQMRGFRMVDLVALMLNRNDDKRTPEFIDNMDDLFDEVVRLADDDAAEKEKKTENQENDDMGMEDTKIVAVGEMRYDPITDMYTDKDGCIC